MSGYVSLTINDIGVYTSSQFTFNLTISYKNSDENTAFGTFTINYELPYLYAAIPSGDIFSVDSVDQVNEDKLNETLGTYVEHSYESNNSVIWISNDDQYEMECPVGIRVGTMQNKSKLRATIIFELQDRDQSYMSDILANYTDIFHQYYMTLDLGVSSGHRLVNGSLKSYITMTISQTNPQRFQLRLDCSNSENTILEWNKGTTYTFESYCSISYRNFRDDIYLALMRAKVDTKLEFTIIGDYYA